MDELIGRLRERADFEDERYRPQTMVAGLGVELYTESVTGALLREAADALEAARVEIERLNRILGRIVAGDGDSTVRIRWSIDAFDAAREYLRPNTV